MVERMGGTVTTPIEALTLCDINNACNISSVLNCIDADRSYRGSVLMNFHGETIVTRTRELALRYERRGPHIARDSSDSVFVHMNRGSQSFRGTQMGREWILQPGEAAIYVHNEPVLLESHAGGDFLGISLPRSLTLDWEELPEDMVGQAFNTAAPAFRLLVPYLEFLSEGDVLNAPVTQMALRHATELVQTCVGGRQDGDLTAETRHRQYLRRISLYLKGRLADHDLSIGELAGAFGVSVRTIQHILTQNDTSFSRLLGRLRAERAYRLLSRTEGTDRSIMAVAYDCGFTDMSAFYRHFRLRYERLPTSVRSDAKGD